MDIPLISDLHQQGVKPEYLYWVGCAGAFDKRYQKVAQAFATILNNLGVDYGVLGTEETCTGDAAKRAGNEMLFQMQALTNIETFKKYNITKIICTCAHCYNTIKNDYPSLGANYEVIHYCDFLKNCLEDGSLKLNPSKIQSETITFHDPCYLGRGNGIYDSPRDLIKSVFPNLIEMSKCKSSSFCCGGGGAQMFKEAEQGDTEIYIERAKQVNETEAKNVASACPFCMTMLTDGIKNNNDEENIKNLDIAEIILTAIT